MICAFENKKRFLSVLLKWQESQEQRKCWRSGHLLRMASWAQTGFLEVALTLNSTL